MVRSAQVRKALLSLHVLSSVGWVGAVVVYMALGVGVVTTDDATLVRSIYATMDWAAWVVLVPLALASMVTGIVQSLATKWGLVQHYWVIFKAAITLVATAVLVVYTSTLNAFSAVARDEPFSARHLEFLSTPSVLIHSTGAFILLVAATLLAVYKPAGLTRRGHRFRQRARTAT